MLYCNIHLSTGINFPQPGSVLWLQPFFISLFGVMIVTIATYCVVDAFSALSFL